MTIATLLFEPTRDNEVIEKRSHLVDKMVGALYNVAAQSLFETAAGVGIDIDCANLIIHADRLQSGISRLWTPELGYALELASLGAPLASTALAQLALANARFGHDQDVTFNIASHVNLLFAGIPLPSSNLIRVQGSADRVEISMGALDLATKLVFIRDGATWKNEDNHQYLRTLVPRTEVVITAGNCVDTTMVYAYESTVAPTDFGSAVESISAVYRLIDDVTPHYSRWVRQLVRQIHVIGQYVGDVLNSSGRSSELRPGHITSTSPQEVIHHAESIVHESSHQHFFLLNRVTRLTNEEGTNARMLSPLNGKMRNMDRILVAYHAVANMILFHSAVIEAAPKHQEMAERRLQYLRPIGRDYLTAMNDHISMFTADGLAFWQPSAAAVAQLCE